ncbi:MAG: hypothetical protein CME40_03175 [Haliea sp.]|nr:hypothetical protein [Haliea sp.]|tara:strand:+ start:159882 stop:160067 length:186 start_codon:yes stop_codon:yes gene_type:complete
MAELHWILLLFPHNIKPQTKREFFREIWELSEEPFDSTHPLLEDIVLEFAPEPQHPRVNGG